MVRDGCIAHQKSWVGVIHRKCQYVNNPWLVCAVRECFPALSFCPGLETSPLFICTLETFVAAGMGLLKPAPNACEIPDSTWGSCSEQQKETGAWSSAWTCNGCTAPGAAAWVSSWATSFPSSKGWSAACSGALVETLGAWETNDQRAESRFCLQRGFVWWGG